MTSHFDERSGIIPCSTPWGRWWQTVHEVWIEVHLEPGTRARNVKVDVKPNYLKCMVHEKTLFEGKLRRTVVADDTIWTIEGQNLLQIQMIKADPYYSEVVWSSLLEEQYTVDPWTYNEVQKKLDLEKFQIENPGFDFSNAKLSKSYN